MPIEAQLLIDHAITSTWDALPDDTQTPERVESAMLESVAERLAAFKANPQAFRPKKPIDKDAIKQRFVKAYAPWTAEETSRLGERFRNGASVTTLTGEFQRSRGAITRRLEKLGLLEPR